MRRQALVSALTVGFSLANAEHDEAGTRRIIGGNVVSKGSLPWLVNRNKQ